jgi:stress-induced morphogen
MDLTEIEHEIESTIQDASARVEPSRGHGDDDHLAARVVSPAFEGKSLVDQHEMVYDALGDRMTEEIHALEVKTYTPEEAPEGAG